MRTLYGTQKRACGRGLCVITCHKLAYDYHAVIYPRFGGEGVKNEDGYEG